MSLWLTFEELPDGEVLPAEEGEEEDDVGGLDDDGPDACLGDLCHAYKEGACQK